MQAMIKQKSIGERIPRYFLQQEPDFVSCLPLTIELNQSPLGA